ncbi:MAG: DUF3017 domain-containing protein [Pseudonocardia sp.]|uniref:DUF3017 domain-containing protein n=1 Tax=unclassified Pseudonocardia TaxID=2619320 RepID=UPI00086A93AB|nr:MULTISPECIES: DUF3017 domain-containing protein [unclassified Pseudonocardia]MBN9108690.1 DUF3017 domain-containing protein [Pseudonocardia sp.]ODV07685.1 MAG: hypothetical protein ABT15_06255 [Pseudonocardia sp. SCN 73-27]RTL70639.1 MAG: DUF3017 domain-containing protein [Pseudonocardiaceae bacterium]
MTDADGARRGWRAVLADHGGLLLVLAIALAGMQRVLTAHWREGAVLLGGALIVAAVLRVILPQERTGLLAIRSKVVDVLLYSSFGLVMTILAVTITRVRLSAP